MGHAGCRGITADPEDRTGDGFYEGAVAARGAVLNETPAVESIESRGVLAPCWPGRGASSGWAVAGREASPLPPAELIALVSLPVGGVRCSLPVGVVAFLGGHVCKRPPFWPPGSILCEVSVYEFPCLCTNAFTHMRVCLSRSRIRGWAGGILGANSQPACLPSEAPGVCAQRRPRPC